MQEIVQQLIDQLLNDQKFSNNTKSAYKSDFNELIEYINKTNSKVKDVNQEWVKNYLKYLEETNKEKNSYNRRASTFRYFLKFLYLNKLAPTNYSLIVGHASVFEKDLYEDLNKEEIIKLIDELDLPIEKKIILLLLGKTKLTATQIASLYSYQVDFENKLIKLSDTEKIYLENETFKLLREYLLEYRSKLSESKNILNLFLDCDGKIITDVDIYKFIKDISINLNLEGKLTTRSLKKVYENKTDILTMQKEILNVVNLPGKSL